MRIMIRHRLLCFLQKRGMDMYHIICEGKNVSLKEGSTIGNLWEKVRNGRPEEDAVLAYCDNELADFQTPVKDHVTVRWVDRKDKQAYMAYQRTLIMLLILAVHDIYGPGADVEVQHSLGKGLYCEFCAECVPEHAVLPQEMEKLETRMHEIACAGYPIRRVLISKKKAIAKLIERGDRNSADVLSHLSIRGFWAYRCGEYFDYYFGPMLPDMKYLTCFRLTPYAPGFLLRFPDIGKPEVLPDYKEEPLFARVFLEAERWGEVIGCRNVSDLNRTIENGTISSLIDTAEALHEKKLAHIADVVHEQEPKIRMICISGPSSAGKTTFMKRLLVQMRVNGIRPVTISLDDYYRDRREYAPDGKNDFEDLSALDTDLFQQSILDLLAGKPVHLPRFNFVSGERAWDAEETRLGGNQPVIVEGLHALNPELTRFVPGYQRVNIYLGALTQLSINAHNRISTSDTRLLRRMVRDSQFRSNDVVKTLDSWDSVRSGEERNIFRFQERADIIFNTALIYELPVLKKIAAPLLNSVEPSNPMYAEAQRLLLFLEPFDEMDDGLVPDNSILREFIGPRKLQKYRG